jgi:arginine decarboxylase
MVNFNLQAVVIGYGFPYRSLYVPELVARRFFEGLEVSGENLPESERGPLLGQQIAKLRPELDLYLVTDVRVEDVAAKAGATFKRVFFGEEDQLELYFSIMKGVSERYQAPFFNALREYAKQPTGVFHALPLARGKSIMNSNWIGDLGQFYGMNLFMAETSATSGGLDSLLEPTSSLKLAQEYAARAFGSRRTFFATNGTSTCQQDRRAGDGPARRHRAGRPQLPQVAPLRHGPGRRAGHLPRGYPLHEYSMYGAVPIRHIKKRCSTCAAPAR